MRVLLISTYELGRQPFGLASPAAWLREAGFDVELLDLAIEALDERRIRAADLIAFHLPMHTATRLAARRVPEVRRLNPEARLAAFGLYAPMNRERLRELGVGLVIGGEFERELVELARRLDAAPAGAAVAPPAAPVSLERLAFRVPDRRGLPALSSYAHLHAPDGSIKLVGSTEASRGCKHLCRHCPIVPVYGGRFRVVPREVVLEDVRRQVAAGAQHVTFGDPDFWNGIGHAIPIVRALHAEHPALTYDVTIKIEHLLAHREHLATLRDTGCLFVTSAVESLDDAILAKLDKGHTRLGFLEALAACRAIGLPLQPTFVAFTPWIDHAGYRRLLEELAALDLVDGLASVQLAIRLLIPAGSRLLELDEIHGWLEPYDRERLVHPWRHPDPAVDRLQREVESRVREGLAHGESRRAIFSAVWEFAHAEHDEDAALRLALERRPEPVAYLDEPWYC